MSNLDLLKEDLIVHNVTIKMRTRKLSTGPKMYFTLTGPGSHATFYREIMPIVRQYYPNAYTTSGGFFGTNFSVTLAEQ